MNRFSSTVPPRRRILLILLLAIPAICLLTGQALQTDDATMSDVYGKTWADVAGDIWHHPLAKIRGNEIEVNQVIISLAILLGGIWLSRRLTRIAYRRLESRLDKSVAAAIRRLLFYVLTAIVVFVSLEVVQIPLTAFTFLGGALAIGIGFGAQNLINNFISGLILMMEQPVRIGDLLEVEGNQGHVESIGYRYTLLKKTDGIDLLVPNSTLLEKNVVNWTLSDKRIRTSVTVGVAYGSPTDKVAGLIRKAVDEHGSILDSPEPIVTFDDFGDSALVFEAHFWSEVETFMDLRIIRSDVRFRIDQLFRESGIVIAFPQHDVHLDTLRPLDVRLTHPGNAS